MYVVFALMLNVLVLTVFLYLNFSFETRWENIFWDYNSLAFEIFAHKMFDSYL